MTLLLVGASSGLSAQDPVPIRGIVTDAGTGGPVPDATVRATPGGEWTQSDSTGTFTLQLPEGDRIGLHVAAFGYESRYVTVVSGTVRQRMRIVLEPVPVRLRPLTVQATRIPRQGTDRERALFDREVTPGVVGIDRPEIRGGPVVVEPDILRSFHSLPGVVPLNDLAAQLHVRGGGPDQNAFYLDGARIFAPYHMFGLFGAFNADVVDRTELYRASFPARFGGTLSSVVDVRQRGGATAVDADGSVVVEGSGGLSLMGGRMSTWGSAFEDELRWSLGVRRTHADLTLGSFTAPDPFPFAFHDMQGRIELDLNGSSQLAASFFDSSDRFRLFFDGADEALRSRWSNRAASIHWTSQVSQGWAASAVGWASRYRGELRVGEPTSAGATESRVAAAGLRLEAVRRGDVLGLRTGIDAEWADASLAGSPDSVGYMVGHSRSESLRTAFYLEVDRWFGPVRLSPGIRTLVLPSRERSLLFEPRLAARLHLARDLALTLGLSRSHQHLFALRDDRYLLPGAPLWMGTDQESAESPSRSDAAIVALEGWPARTWSFEVGLYARRLTNIPRWRPDGVRDLRSLDFDDGQALGAELFVRRHEGTLSGWVGYGLSNVTMEAPTGGGSYSPPWDRRHALDVTAVVRASDSFTTSIRIAYGSGLPFWPPAGTVNGRRYDPILGRTRQGDDYPVWAQRQERFPDYVRVDLGARLRLQVGSMDLEPYLSLLNATNHANVLFYETGQAGPGGPPVLQPTVQFPLVPVLGIDVAF